MAELSDRTGYLVRMIAKPAHWTLGYQKNSVSDNWMLSHSLYGYFYPDGRDGRVTMRDYRRTVFTPGKWAHVAWVWGPHEYRSTVARLNGSGVMCRLYVNGRASQQYTYTRAGNFPSDMPTQFMLLNVNNLSKEKGTTFDELRISDIVRYKEDFTPPSRGTQFQLDQHTRALFHFDGTLDGQSAAKPGKPVGELSTR